jgi:hypothetical protein
MRWGYQEISLFGTCLIQRQVATKISLLAIFSQYTRSVHSSERMGRNHLDLLISMLVSKGVFD